MSNKHVVNSLWSDHSRIVTVYNLVIISVSGRMRRQRHTWKVVNKYLFNKYSTNFGICVLFVKVCRCSTMHLIRVLGKCIW